MPPEATQTCYSPSDKTISVREIGEDGPRAFLPYDTDYVVNLTANIKDKKGGAFPAQTITMPVGSFKVLAITSPGQSVNNISQDISNSLANVA